MFIVNFSVLVPFHILGQRVFLTGSSKELGSWDARKALKLKKDKDGFWIGSTQISNDPVIMYLYFIGHSIKTETADEKILTISRWEELVKPRCLTFSDVCGLANLRDVFGEEKSINGNFANKHGALKLTGDLKLFKKRKKILLDVDGTENIKMSKSQQDPGVKELIVEQRKRGPPKGPTHKQLKEENIQLKEEVRGLRELVAEKDQRIKEMQESFKQQSKIIDFFIQSTGVKHNRPPQAPNFASSAPVPFTHQNFPTQDLRTSPIILRTQPNLNLLDAQGLHNLNNQFSGNQPLDLPPLNTGVLASSQQGISAQHDFYEFDDQQQDHDPNQSTSQMESYNRRQN